VIAGVVIVCTINLGACNYATPVVCIEAMPENKGVAAMYMDLQKALSDRRMLQISSVDSCDGRITLCVAIYDDAVWECCEEVLYLLAMDRRCQSVGYCIQYY